VYGKPQESDEKIKRHKWLVDEKADEESRRVFLKGVDAGGAVAAGAETERYFLAGR